MQLNPVASTILVVFFVIASLFLIAVIAVLALALIKMQQTLTEYKVTVVDPLMAKTDALLTLVTERLDEASEHTIRILADTEAATNNVQERVEKTAEVVQQTVSRPLIGINALAAGVGRGLATFAFLQKQENTEKNLIRRNQADNISVGFNNTQSNGSNGNGVALNTSGASLAGGDSSTTGVLAAQGTEE